MPSERHHIPLLGLLVAALLLPTLAAAQEAGADGDEVVADKPWQGRNAFEVWEEEHRWFRLGMRAYGLNPAIDDHAALKLGAGITVPLTTDFFMGIGMKIAFNGAYNRGNECVNRGGVGEDPLCPSGHKGGVDYTWREPLVTDASTGNTTVDGTNPDAQPSATAFMQPQRRPTHIAFYALTIGGNYEVTIPNLQFFRIFQPFVGGGVMIAWIYTYSDITEQEFVLINNSENDPFDPDNVDPWADQGPEVGGEVYGGFHLNLSDVFRFTVELGYYNVLVQEAPLNKATDGYDAKHLEYRLAQLRFGGGFEFRF